MSTETNTPAPEESSAAQTAKWRDRAQKAEVEVERLTRELAMWDHGTRAERERQRAEKAEAKIEEIRAALGDDGRRTHYEIVELATKASEWREWKEKYIALKNAHIAEGQDPSGTIWEHADKLQAELKASKAEVEKLKELVKLAARKGDELLEPYRLRAEKAELLLKQIQAFAEILSPTEK
jgi:hypothetical protein